MQCGEGSFSRTQHIAPMRAGPTLVGRRHVEQGECAVKRIGNALGLPGVMRARGALNLAADVRKLLNEGESIPSKTGGGMS